MKEAEKNVNFSLNGVQFEKSSRLRVAEYLYLLDPCCVSYGYGFETSLKLDFQCEKRSFDLSVISGI